MSFQKKPTMNSARRFSLNFVMQTFITLSIIKEVFFPMSCAISSSCFWLSKYPKIKFKVKLVNYTFNSLKPSSKFSLFASISIKRRWQFLIPSNLAEGNFYSLNKKARKGWNACVREQLDIWISSLMSQFNTYLSNISWMIIEILT